MSVCPHCGQPLPEPKEEISPGFLVVPPEGKASLEERYAAIRKEIESARKDLCNGGLGQAVHGALETAIARRTRACTAALGIGLQRDSGQG